MRTLRPTLRLLPAALLLSLALGGLGTPASACTLTIPPSDICGQELPVDPFTTTVRARGTGFGDPGQDDMWFECNWSDSTGLFQLRTTAYEPGTLQAKTYKVEGQVFCDQDNDGEVDRLDLDGDGTPETPKRVYTVTETIERQPPGSGNEYLDIPFVNPSQQMGLTMGSQVWMATGCVLEGCFTSGYGFFWEGVPV